MRTTWWQRFWRWTVTIEAVVFGVGAYEVNTSYNLVHSLNVRQIDTIPGAVGSLIGGAVWALAALTAKALLLVCVPILVIVEGVAWWVRAGRRREEWKEMQRSVAHRLRSEKHGS